MFKNLNKKLNIPTWLFVVLVIVMILRIPSFYMPYSYGDELIYLALGEGIRQGVTLYSEIHDNKPPLLYITAAIAGNLFWFKAILAFWSLATVYVFWKLSEVLLPNKSKAQMVATSIFALLTTLPLLEGNIANAENFMIGPIILAFYLLLKSKTSTKNLVIAGLLFSFASLYKIPAAFDIPAIIFYWICVQKKFNKETFIKLTKRIAILSLAFLAPITLTFIWYYYQGAFKEYLIAAYLQNFGYLSSWRPSDVQKPFFEKNGPLLIRAGVVALAGLVLFINRKKISKQFLFTTFWLFLTLFAVTLSERPYPHYLLQSVAPISILLTTLFMSKKMEQVYSIIPLFFVFFVPYYFNFWHYDTYMYYKRFINFSLGIITTEPYLDSFGGNVQRNYKVASYLAPITKPDEKILVWGDGVAIYALSKKLPPIKYVADYHIRDFSSEAEVLNKISLNPPAFIVIQPETVPFLELSEFVNENYGLIEVIDGVEIWKLLGDNLRAILN